MEEETGSWVRRVNFSHTVYHRLDSSLLRSASVPFSLSAQIDGNPAVKPTALSRKPPGAAANSSSGRTRPISQSACLEQRSKSPLPEIPLSEEFREARSDSRRRSSTPCPRRKEPDKRGAGRLFSGQARDSGGAVGSLPSSRSGARQKFSFAKGPARLFSEKISEKMKNKGRKESSWSKYFDHGGGRGRVSAVDSMPTVNASEEWMVDLSKLFIGLRFASGAHSRLYYGIYRDRPVAIKMITVPDDDENGAMGARLEKQFTTELSVLAHLHHRNVIKLVAACSKPPIYFLITEYLSGGSLRAFLHKLERKPLPLEKIIAFSLDIARAMEYVHSQGFIHRDLKPENILFDEDSCLKVADFGIACEAAHRESIAEAEDPGTYRWMAPEMIKHKCYSQKVDVYGFGLVLWEMVTGTIPYEEMTPVQAAYAVVNKDLRPEIPVDCPVALQALIKQCWSTCPEKRPEFWQIVKVLEQFESSLARDGIISLIPYSPCPDHKKRLIHWIQKLRR
ncbi:hypothetical protein ACLOJK_008598 [Asimina triloba]